MIGDEPPEQEAPEEAEKADGDEEGEAHALRHELALLAVAAPELEAQHALHRAALAIITVSLLLQPPPRGSRIYFICLPSAAVRAEL